MPTKLYVIPVFIFMLAIVGSYFAFMRDTEARKRHSSEATAFVTNTDVRRKTSVDDGREQTVDVLATYEYEINGTLYRRSVRKSQIESVRFVPWGNAKVCYDPADQTSIENAELYPSDHLCGN